MRNMLNVMQYAHDSLNSATDHGKLLKRRFLFYVHAHLFDIDSLLGHRILLTMIGNDFCLQCFDAVGWAAGRASGL